MSGGIIAGDNVTGGNVYVGGSSYLDMLGIFLWPYINGISPFIADNVYRYFRFRDCTIAFNRLTPKTYMLCYQKICCAFERDLYDFPFLRGHGYTFALTEWRENIKPIFENSNLFNKTLIAIQPKAEDFQELLDSEEWWVKDEIETAKENRSGAKITPANEPVNWDIYPNEYYPIVWDFFDGKYGVACEKFDVFFKNYRDKEQIEIASLVARLMILKAKSEWSFGIDDNSTYKCFLDIYGERKDNSIQYLRSYYESFLLMARK